MLLATITGNMSAPINGGSFSYNCCFVSISNTPQTDNRLGPDKSPPATTTTTTTRRVRQNSLSCCCCCPRDSFGLFCSFQFRFCSAIACQLPLLLLQTLLLPLLVLLLLPLLLLTTNKLLLTLSCAHLVCKSRLSRHRKGLTATPTLTATAAATATATHAIFLATSTSTTASACFFSPSLPFFANFWRVLLLPFCLRSCCQVCVRVCLRTACVCVFYLIFFLLFFLGTCKVAAATA